uniref:Transcription factor bHLH18-like isoform X1 n=2 Tax=Cicer arietinum TaxID=3827 RepID=A0A3Q7XKN2_CICAR|nr:transcription factor bHLH18-like isoform X1 [Cicer arietinum]
MDGDKSPYLDEDMFLVDNMEQTNFFLESANSNINIDNVCVTTIQENMLNNSNTSNSLISQEYNYASNSQQEPSQYILSFEKSIVELSPNSAIATCSSIMGQKTTLNNNVSELPKAKERTKSFRSSSETQDHILAERKRRQVITERFIALSAIIPGLKRTDKAYILREAINYVKQLQEKVKDLENPNKMKKGDSLIFIKNSQASTTEETTSCEEKIDNSKKELPKVEARVIEKEILIEIHCEKQKDIVVRLMVLLQNLHLSLACSSVLPFGNSILKVTIIAQMNDEYCMTMNDLVKTLRQDLLESHDNQKYIFKRVQ